MNGDERQRCLARADKLRKAAIDAGMSEHALARASGLPLLTVRQALLGTSNLSGALYDGLHQACREEAAKNRRFGRTAQG